MNTVRIVKNDAAPIFFDNDGSVLDKDYGYCYKLQDTIEAKTSWTAEEVAVLAGMSDAELDEIGQAYIYSYNPSKYSWIGRLPFSDYLRSHIQEILKRQG